MCSVFDQTGIVCVCGCVGVGEWVGVSERERDQTDIIV